MTIQRPESSGTIEQTQGELLQASSRLREFAADADAAYRIALVLAPTPFIPTSYRKRGDQWLEKDAVAQTAAAAMLSGDEVGLSPMQSLASIDVIEGKPALNALAQRALVQAHGHDVWIHERIADGRGDRSRVSVTVRGRRAGSDHIAESTWSLDRARQAGLLSKRNWQNHPEAMCFARASSDVCRQIAADVLLGLAYSTEELQDEEDLALSSPGSHSVGIRPRGEGEEAQVSTPEEIRQQEGSEPAAAPTPEPAGEEPQGEPTADTEPDTAQEEPICGKPKEGEERLVCSRPFEHSGRHYYGKELTDEELAARPAATPEEPEPIKDPETTEPVLREGLADPEAPARCPETHPTLGQCSLPAGHEGQHRPEPQEEESSAPAQAEQEEELPIEQPQVQCPYHKSGMQCELVARHEGPHSARGNLWGDAEADGEAVDAEVVEEGPEGFEQPSEEEQAAAFEAEQAARAEQPAQPSAATDADDPWADFQ